MIYFFVGVCVGVNLGICAWAFFRGASLERSSVDSKMVFSPVVRRKSVTENSVFISAAENETEHVLRISKANTTGRPRVFDGPLETFIVVSPRKMGPRGSSERAGADRRSTPTHGAPDHSV